MPPGRKTYDANLLRRSSGNTKWRNTLGSKSAVNKYASTKRTNRHAGTAGIDESRFSEDHDKDRYLITYADLITLLLGLFIILYAVSNIDSGKYQKIISAMGNILGNKTEIVNLEGSSFENAVMPENKLKNDLINLINDFKYENSIKLEENERGITIHIMEEILFASGSAELNKNSTSVLNAISGIIKKLPNDIRIEGHTDNVPINTSAFPSNWHLSVGRALNTAYYLIEKGNISPEKVSVVGNSEYKPMAENNSVEGRTTNRRVDIVIIK